MYILAVIGGALLLVSLTSVSHWLSFDRRQLMDQRTYCSDDRHKALVRLCYRTTLMRVDAMEWRNACLAQ